MLAPEPIRLSALNAKIKQAIAGAFGAINFWVIADVTNHGFKAAKNYHYFELVEKDPRSSDIMAKISGSAWGNASAKITLFERQTGRFTSNINVLINVSVGRCTGRESETCFLPHYILSSQIKIH